MHTLAQSEHGSGKSGERDMGVSTRDAWQETRLESNESSGRPTFGQKSWDQMVTCLDREDYAYSPILHKPMQPDNKDSSDSTLKTRGREG